MSRSITEKMWADAVAMLDRADQIHRTFFRPEAAGWEPPVDLLETSHELTIIAALPGVEARDIDLVVGSGELAILGTRRLPSLPRPARVHRMELPHGRFERRVGLPPGAYEITRRDLDHGCLTIVLRKLG